MSQSPFLGTRGWPPPPSTPPVTSKTPMNLTRTPLRGCAGKKTSVVVSTTRFPLEEPPSRRGDHHHQVPSREATILTWGWPPPGPLQRNHHPNMGTPASPHRSWGWRTFPRRCRGVAICDRLFPSPPVLSKKNKKGVVCMGRLASPSPGYGFLLFLAGVAADSSACPDLASSFLLFFWKGFILTPWQKRCR